MAGYDPGTLVSLFLEDYAETDPLVCYVDPHAHDKPACDGEENIIRLKDLYTPPDTLPMFRLMAGKNSMTFTDPKLGVRNALSLFIPDMVTVPFANLYAQVSGGESFSVNYANAITGTLLGVLGGVNVQAHGSSLVETSGGLAKHTAMLTDENVDVKRYEFNAAYFVSESWPSYVMEITLAAGTSALAANYLPLPYGSIAKAAIGVGAAAGISSSIVTAFGAGIMDLASSHNLPIDNVYDNQNTWRADYSNTVSPIAGSSVNDTTITPLVMEDFLYERPFVNLALLDSATLDTLSKMELPDREKSTLNRNCYYLGDRGNARFAVGLFKSADDLNSSQKTQPVSSLRPLRFKSELDWSKMGVKVDRWERVPGLTPDGNVVDTLVPIRHVERYEAPAVTVDDWIEKYSFVVDDLMPHRLRQIRMNFNYQEEIA